MAVGRISGPLLKDNLQRNGVNLAFETNLLYLDVNNSRIGVNTTTPTNDLSVNGTTRTTNLYISTQATLANLTISGSTISSSGNITFSPGGGSPTVSMTTVSPGNLQLTGNTISSTNTNGAININANGTGVINLNNNVLINGSLHATGTITADGNIQLGDAVTDTITFTGEVNSNILPSTNNTYTLGSASLQWSNVYTQGLTTSTFSATTLNTTTFNTANLTISGNTISASTSNTNINFNTTGTGGIVFGNLKFTNNTVTNTVSGAVTSFTQTVSSASFTGSIAPSTAVSIVGSTTLTALSVTQIPFWTVGGSIAFNGSSQNLSFTPGITINQSAFTAECFFYMTGGTTGFIFGGSTNYGFSLKINSLAGPNNISVTPYNQASNNYTVPTISLNTWYHIAVTKNSSGVETVFFGGTRSSTGTIANNLNYQGLTTLVGSQAGAGYFQGSIANIRVVVGTAIYDPTASTITVPTVNLTNVANTKLLLTAGNPTTFTTDASTILQTVTNNGTTFGALTPFQSGTPTIITGMAVTGGGLVAGTYVTSNISGSGTSSTSSWGINISQSVSSTTLTGTPVILTVTGTPTGTILNGMSISGGSGGNTILAGSVIASFGTGSGAAGTYYVSPSQTITSITISGTLAGYAQFSGNSGVVIPVGSNSNRPSTLYSEVGMIRYNTDQQYVEVYNGSSWSSVAGSSTGVTTATANSLGAGLALALG
jgi:hypothetical protein